MLSLSVSPALQKLSPALLWLQDCAAAVFTCFFRLLRRGRQPQCECRAPRLGVELERAAHRLGELVRDRQAEPAAGGDRPLGAIKTLEDLPPVSPRHARTLLFD